MKSNETDDNHIRKIVNDIKTKIDELKVISKKRKELISQSMLRESPKPFIRVAVNQHFDLRRINIKAAFLK